ncbi:MAG TPA: AMP-binding protein, partial [Acidimicrobiales bacterium]|nr:AMP-binding protein [Acidimicrobiales bacterium]
MPRLVALDMPGGPEFVAQLERAWDAGDAVLPIDPRLSPSAKRRIVETMQPAVIVTPDGETALTAARPTEPGDALVMATSGTTGDPKGVVLTHAAVTASAAATNSRLGVGTSDSWWANLPVAHVGGMSVITRCLVAGIRCEV